MFFTVLGYMACWLMVIATMFIAGTLETGEIVLIIWGACACVVIMLIIHCPITFVLL